MGDASAKTMALQSGQVDLVENITNVSDIQNFQQDANYTVDIASGVRCGFSWMNLNGVLGNKTLRQAILMGIDNDTICSSKTIGGLYTAGFSVLPSTLSYGYDKLVNPYKYDPEGAKKLLDDAGIVDSDGDGFREPVSYTHLRAHETGRNLVCRLLLEKKKNKKKEKGRWGK